MSAVLLAVFKLSQVQPLQLYVVAADLCEAVLVRGTVKVAWRGLHREIGRGLGAGIGACSCVAGIGRRLRTGSGATSVRSGSGAPWRTPVMGCVPEMTYPARPPGRC